MIYIFLSMKELLTSFQAVLSRHMPDQETTKEAIEPNSLLDVDNFDFRNAISVDDNVNNNELSPTGERKARYQVYSLEPLLSFNPVTPTQRVQRAQVHAK